MGTSFKHPNLFGNSLCLDILQTPTSKYQPYRQWYAVIPPRFNRSRILTSVISQESCVWCNISAGAPASVFGWRANSSHWRRTAAQISWGHRGSKQLCVP